MKSIDGIPDFLRISPDVRRAAWERNPPRTTHFLPDTFVRRDDSPEVARIRAEEDERRRLKALARIGKMKRRLQPVDRSNQRWDARRNKWVDDTPTVHFTQTSFVHVQKPTKVQFSAPTTSPTGRFISGPEMQNLSGTPAHAMEMYLAGVRPDRSALEAQARAAGVWKDSYAQLSNGLFAMTIRNRLKKVQK